MFTDKVLQEVFCSTYDTAEKIGKPAAFADRTAYFVVYLALLDLQNTYTVSNDDNWRVQEILAKSFDEFCKKKGYENAIPIIDEWLKNSNPNTRRAVTEGLRIWTSRPYFKENPMEAIERLADLREDSSAYVRKSVGNALRDISKKYPELIKTELDSWKLESKEINQVYKLANKFVK